MDNEAETHNPLICEGIPEWGIARLGNKASISGNGYGCKVMDSDLRVMGSSVCKSVKKDTLGVLKDIWKNVSAESSCFDNN